MKKTLNRDFYVFETGMISLRHGTKFQKKFHKWYMSYSNIVPGKIYDYLVRKNIVK